MLNYDELIGFKVDKGAVHYKTDSVEAYYKNSQSVLKSLKAENDDLLSKMSILADKIEEYRNDEENIRAALLGAQRLGDGVIKEAHSKADDIIREAEAKARFMISEAQKSIAKEQLTLSSLQKEVSDFKTRILSIYKAHLEQISSLPNDGSNETQYDDGSEQEEIIEANEEKQDTEQTSFLEQVVEEKNMEESLEQKEEIIKNIDETQTFDINDKEPVIRFGNLQIND